jgi:crotonobetainyl-CoA:carnitine CoA-transferase CaiB-like acyl-CoA transferase
VELQQDPGKLKTTGTSIRQHTEEILLELGYSWDDIGNLKEQEVI